MLHLMDMVMIIVGIFNKLNYHLIINHESLSG